MPLCCRYHLRKNRDTMEGVSPFQKLKSSSLCIFFFIFYFFINRCTTSAPLYLCGSSFCRAIEINVPPAKLKPTDQLPPADMVKLHCLPQPLRVQRRKKTWCVDSEQTHDISRKLLHKKLWLCLDDGSEASHFNPIMSVVQSLSYSEEKCSTVK